MSSSNCRRRRIRRRGRAPIPKDSPFYRYGTRLKGTEYDFRVPNPPYSILNDLPYTYKDEHSIQYYRASETHSFVQLQREKGVRDPIFWTLRPIVRGAGRRMTPFPRLGDTIEYLFGRDGYTYRADVAEDHRHPRHATGWVILSNIRK